MTDPSTWSKAGALVSIANMFTGTVEAGGDNKGAFVERFQRAVDGKAVGEPWCMAFVWFCINAVQSLWVEAALPGHDNGPRLTPSEHVLTVWNKANISQRLASPERGCLMIWQFFDDAGNPTAKGHVGIVIDCNVSPLEVTTIEGNTGPGGAEVERDGDGVFVKQRTRAGTKKMHVVGYLRVW